MTEPDIDLSKLPAPAVVEDLDYETLRQTLLELARDLIGAEKFDALVESDPLIKLVEALAYRELTLRQRVNDAARSVMLAFAAGTDLDHLAALYAVERQVDESDADLRKRVQLAPSALSVAGPAEAYRFHGLSADDKVKDIAVESPSPGDVTVTVLSTRGDGTPLSTESHSATVTLAPDSAGLEGREITGLTVTGEGGSPTYSAGTDYRLEGTTLWRLTGGSIESGATLEVSYTRAAELRLVELELNHEDVRPLTDNVTVQAATITTYQADAKIYIGDEPDAEVVRRAAEEALRSKVSEMHALGQNIYRSALFAAAHQPGVVYVELTSPADDITVPDAGAAYASSVSVSLGS